MSHPEHPNFIHSPVPEPLETQDPDLNLRNFNKLPFSSKSDSQATSIGRAKTEKLKYEIDSWSSHSASYHPKNIMVDNPQEQSSRWSSGSNTQTQFITLKLEKLSVVHSITFGKYHKVHVCNLKEFKVFGGMSPNNMIELLHSGLKNDNDPETFPLKHKTNNLIFPCQYIKIMPLMAWGANFNYSIWYVELRGICDAAFVEKTYTEYINYREQEAVRLCLKYFRQRNHQEAFTALQNTTGLLLEDPMLTNLHTNLVLNGNFQTAEKLVNQAATSRLFDDYISQCEYKPVWKRVIGTNKDGLSPCVRGGHQMCIDVQRSKIYLLGGWDGYKDLGDFWVFDISERTWSLINEDTAKEGGPGPRSCHKICFDDTDGDIYVLGRYVDVETRANTNLESDFYRYNVVEKKWTCISRNTKAEHGPDLIYDQQMCVDNESRTMYVFGGRNVHPDPNHQSYSGMYTYHIPSNTWKLVRSDKQRADQMTHLKSRNGHSMLFDPKERQLYIFAGQRNKDYLSDFYVYDVDEDVIHEKSKDYWKQGGLDAGFTQRATLDVDLREFYVLSGLMKERVTSQDTVKNSFWVYHLKSERWQRVYQNENVDPNYWNRMSDIEPCPRFAHQLVYDSKNKVHYLFGGNPGVHGNPTQRLDDFWELYLLRPNASDVLRRATFFIRKQRFREMCKSGPSIDALNYLQHQVSEVVNHHDTEESAEFRTLTTSLFGQEEPGEVDKDATHQERTELYETLLEYFPEEMKQPKGNLVDLVPMK
ncbi:hypothetical protein K493DRAFT_64679 [Basidiobolus meristosporus CBS 931.73]|uniref:Uncharacterized protein n=1 Tax=Basidiobolus meristosporus CBS 931.73 TaxID=1314790 RepID=A0A1Y1XVQ4_9FUNG|nr:hypothetical protein K493DRAFT_64679 [Basidiobolus meristosporus CBS 931.73]|eukprot:ORX89838.1 hypothetical protein K493DRAFT_64679 [Basidiobolus meristosporus CBS 931.73]